MSTKANNQRIAKNTLLLYFRMLLTMIVSLYTVRVVLNTLGVVDYGIYNVVGGIVVMFSFLSNTMASASQRFFAFELGRNDIFQLKRTFSMTLFIYAIIIVIILFLSETIGLWFLNNKLVIPVGRMDAANWIYQFAILSFVVTILRTPYNASIIAHENMKFFAYISIVEVSLKLLIVYMLVLFSFDKLKLYSVLMFCTVFLVSIVYRIFCKKKYQECVFEYVWDKRLFKELLSYSGWNLFGSLAGIFNNQGVNILLNIFFGPIINAARAIAYQVSSAVNQFVFSFFNAVRPQITKYYAKGQTENMMNLVFQSSKISFFLLLIITMPILLECHFVLSFWLQEIPEYVVLFTRLVIINALIDCLSYPLQTTAQSTGNIKLYQFVVGGTLLFNLPISYLFLKIGYPPQVTMIVGICISIICLGLRLILLKKLVDFQVLRFLKRVVFRVLLVTIVAYCIPVILINFIYGSFSRFVILSITGVVMSMISIFIIGISTSERRQVFDFLIRKIRIVKLKK
jgi:O-antigen/teichoic acid export membrane protein